MSQLHSRQIPASDDFNLILPRIFYENVQALNGLSHQIAPNTKPNFQNTFARTSSWVYYFLIYVFETQSNLWALIMDLVSLSCVHIRSKYGNMVLPKYNAFLLLLLSCTSKMVQTQVESSKNNKIHSGWSQVSKFLFLRTEYRYLKRSGSRDRI